MLRIMFEMKGDGMERQWLFSVVCLRTECGFVGVANSREELDELIEQHQAGIPQLGDGSLIGHLIELDKLAL
jgi:hypothetical protein